MGNVMIRCPTTGEKVWTGLEMDAEMFAMVDIQGRGFRCGACDKVHKWKKADATVQSGKWPEEKLVNPE